MRRLTLYILPLMMAIGCNKAETIEVVHLGAVEKEIFVPSTTHIDTISLVTDVHYDVEIIEGEHWLTLGATGMFPLSRKEIPFRCEANYGFRRVGKVTLSAATRVDTVYIKQEGALADVITLIPQGQNLPEDEIAKAVFEVPADGGRYTMEVECCRHPVALSVEVSSTAMLETEYRDGFLHVTVAQTVQKDPKTYTVTLYYLDGWGERVTAVATFNQKPRL